ncbi:MAG: hypothetical protein ACR2MX_02260 [Cyclobacteriaceae bacterium]
MNNPIQSIAQTPTPKLEESMDFYGRLGFKTISTEPIALVTDGKVVIQINPDRKARAGIKLYQKDWSEIVQRLKPYTNVLEMEDGYVAADPSGVYLYLSEEPPPTFKGLADQPAAKTGNFAGISIESLNFEKSLQFWQAVGYKITNGAADQGWVSLSNGSSIDISIMTAGSCPHLFFNPSYTYFNGNNNPEVIRNIRDLGVQITEEITVFNQEGIVDNIIIRDPGGFGFFLFSD